jgi:hypothetical protein
MTGPAVRECRVSQAQELDREIWDLFDGVFLVSGILGSWDKPLFLGGVGGSVSGCSMVTFWGKLGLSLTEIGGGCAGIERA